MKLLIAYCYIPLEKKYALEKIQKAETIFYDLRLLFII